MGRSILNSFNVAPEKIPAIIPCGAKGSMSDLIAIPKQLLFYEDKPLMYKVLNNLDENVVKEVLVTTGYMAPMLEGYIDSVKSQFRFKIQTLLEKRGEGGQTPGSQKCDLGFLLRCIKRDRPEFLGETFLIHYSDIVAPGFNWSRLLSEHKRARAKDSNIIGTLAVSRTHKFTVGIVYAHEGDEAIVKNIAERPRGPDIPVMEGRRFFVNMAISLFEPRIMDFVQKDDDDLYGKIIASAQTSGCKFAYYEHTGVWYHIDDRLDINSANTSKFADYCW